LSSISRYTSRSMSGKTGILRIHRVAGLRALALILALGLSLAATNLQAHASGSEPLLPNLVADPPDNTSLATDSSTGTARLLLRFNGYVHNVGPGALDFRGAREAPKVSQKTTEEVEHAREHEETLPQKTEEELATPPMKVFQRLYTTNEGKPEESEKYLERPHDEEPSGGEMIYVNADGHHHWHLQKVAKYSLWNATKTAEVAPAQKVGFCLEDSQHVETNIGPKTAVYADNVAPYRDFCQQYRPNATSVYEGISPGWRDVYSSELAFQWVDVSDVIPGEYWLREDVNPLGVIKEVAGTNTPAYATSPTIIPGFDAQAQTTSTRMGEATTIGLTSKAWSDSATPKYTIVSQTKHGKLGTVSKNQVTYTPEAGFTGTDSFTFSAADPNSQFPESPTVATVSIEVSASGTTNLLLAGSATSTYSVGDQTTAGREEAFQFVAKSSGTVEELQFRTDGTADTGLTGVILGVLAESAGKPGEVLGAAKVSGLPAINSWIKATGLSIPVVSGTDYWLVVLPLGPSSAKLYYDAAVASGGTGNLESATGGLSAMTAESSWEAFNQGPVGFQAIGSTKAGSAIQLRPVQTRSASAAMTVPGQVVSAHVQVGNVQVGKPQPAVAIAGGQSSMIAGTSVQLSAIVANDSPGVSWSASAGTITSGGLYTAPSVPPSARTVTVTAVSAEGARDQSTITIMPVPANVAAPAAPLSAEEVPSSLPRSTRSRLGGSSSAVSPAVAPPEAVLVGRTLVMTTGVTVAGRVRLSAYLGKRRLGSCEIQTPADRSFTCRLTLGGRVSLHAPVRVLASLRVGGDILRSLRRAAPVAKMKMNGAFGETQFLSNGHAAASWRLICSPSQASSLSLG
jgi:hypothetical protein